MDCVPSVIRAWLISTMSVRHGLDQLCAHVPDGVEITKSPAMAEETKNEHPPCFCEQYPTCCECLVFPTASMWAILACAPGFSNCPAIPHLSLFVLITSTLLQLNDMAKWFCRLPFNPSYQDNKSTMARLTNILDALVLGLCVWGCSMSLPAIDRLPHGGGHQCTLPVFLTGFLCSVMPPFVVLLRLVLGWCLPKTSLDAEKPLESLLDQDYGQVSTTKVDAAV